MSRIVFLRVLAFAVACLCAPGIGRSSTDVAGGLITTSTTWTSAGQPYRLLGNVTVAGGATLTIEPGVEVRFAGDFFLKVGGSGAEGPGTLVAIGTLGSRIVFRSDGAPQAGSWRYVWFEFLNDGTSRLEHCDVEDAGSATAAILCTDASNGPTISDVAITRSATDGVRIASSAPSFEGLLETVGMSGYAFFSPSPSFAPAFSGVSVECSGKLGRGGVALWSEFFASNPTVTGGAFEAEVYAGTIAADATLGGVQNVGVSLLGGITVGGAVAPGPVLTIRAGTTVTIPPGSILNVGTNGSLYGDLVVEGTSGSPVVLTSSDAGPAISNHWGPLTFSNRSSAVSSIDDCLISHGGRVTAAVFCSGASPALSNLSIDQSWTKGLFLSLSSPAVTDLTVTNTVEHAVYVPDSVSAPSFAGSVSIDAAGALGRGRPDFWADLFSASMSVTGDGYLQEVVGGTLTKSSTWGKGVGDPVHVIGSLTIAGSSVPVLDVLPGSRLQLDLGGQVIVGSPGAGGDLRAVGTALDPILFQQESPGDAWNQIQFGPSSTSASVLEHCDLNGGGLTPATVVCLASSPTLRDVSIVGSAASGISLSGGAAPVLAGALELSSSPGHLILAQDSTSVASFQSPQLSSTGLFARGGAAFWHAFFGSGATVTGGPYDAEIFGGVVSSDASWGGVSGVDLRLLAGLTIAAPSMPGPLLTIASGTTLRVPAGSSIGVGIAGAQYGDLLVQGTPSEPVLITSDDPGPSSSNHWGPLTFSDRSSAASGLYDCEISYGGLISGAVVCFDSSPTMAAVSVTDSWTTGIFLSGSSPLLDDLSVSGAAEHALFVADASSVPTFSGSLTIDAVGALGRGTPAFWSDFYAAGPSVTGDGYSQEVIGGTLVASTAWGKGVGDPIHLLGGLTVSGPTDPILDLVAGTTVRLDPSVAINVGSASGDGGGIRAIGTSVDPIVFEAGDPPDRWSYVLFTDTASPLSALEHCTLSGGGLSQATLVCQSSSPNLTDLAILDSGTNGVTLSAGASPSFSGMVTLAGSSDHLVYATDVASVPTFSNLSVSTSGELGRGGAAFWSAFFGSSPTVLAGPYEAEVWGDVLSEDSTWGSPDVGLRFLANFAIQDASDPTLTIAAGTTVSLDPSVELFIGGFVPANAGCLVAVGSSSTPVLFQGSSAAPWGSLYFGPYASGSSVLDHCTIVGGGSSGAAVNVHGSAVTLRDCTIEDSHQIGLLCQGQATPTLEGNRLRNSGTWGVLSDQCALTLHHCEFVGNVTGGLERVGLVTYAIDATRCWWGSSSGPGAPAGQSVASPAAYDPWLGGAVVDTPRISAVSIVNPVVDPGGPATEWSGTISTPSSWTFEVRQTPQDPVLWSASGSGASFLVSWNGDDGQGQRLPDGPYHYLIHAVDSSTGAVASPVVGTFSIDNTLPRITIVEAPFTNDRVVTLDMDSGPNAWMRLSEDPGFSGASWEPFAASAQWTLSRGDGPKTVHAQFSAYASGWNPSAAVSDTTTLDTVPPQNPSIVINEGSPVSAPSINLTLFAQDAFEMRLDRNPVFPGVSWETYSPGRPWTLQGLDGVHSVCAVFRDEAGNESDPVCAQTELHTGPPDRPMIRASLTGYSNTPNLLLVLIAGGATEMQVAEDSGFAGAAWQPYSRALPFTLSSGAGPKTVFARFRNSTMTPSATVSDTVVIDTTPPVVSISVPASGSTVESGVVAVAGTVDDPDASVFVNGRPAQVNGTSFIAEPIPLLSGANSIQARAEDLAGNLGSASVNVNVTTEENRLDLTALPVAGVPPLSVSFSVQDGLTTAPVQYEWDVEGNGVFDLVTASAVVNHTYVDAAQYAPSVRVTAADGTLYSAHTSVLAHEAPVVLQSIPSQDPMDLALDEDGNLYVVERSAHRIVRYDPGGVQTGVLGTGLGGAPGELDTPHGIGIDPEGRILVADTGNRRIQAFQSDGTLAADFGANGIVDGSTGDVTFDKVWDVAADQGRFLYVSDTARQCMHRLSPDGYILQSWDWTGKSTFGPTGSSPTRPVFEDRLLAVPLGVCLLNDLPTVAVRGIDQVLHFTSSGHLRGRIGSASGSSAPLQDPISASVDSWWDALYVADHGANEVRVFDTVDPTHFESRCTVEGLGLRAPTAVAAGLDDMRQTLFVADNGNGRVLHVELPAESPLAPWAELIDALKADDLDAALSSFPEEDRDLYEVMLELVRQYEPGGLVAFGLELESYPLQLEERSARHAIYSFSDAAGFENRVIFHREGAVWTLLEF